MSSSITQAWVKSLAKKVRSAIAHPPAGPPFTSDLMIRNDGPVSGNDDALTAGSLALSTTQDFLGHLSLGVDRVQAPCERLGGVVREDKGHDSASLTL